MFPKSNSILPIQAESYEVLFGPAAEHLRNLIQMQKFSEVFFLTDDNTQKLCLPIMEQEGLDFNKEHLLCIKPGEENKNLETCSEIWSFLHQCHADRNALLVNLGGGVLTDMGAFSASVFKRGIAFIQIPTSLLSQVDASVGGKTGIDFKGEKNMIGTFTPPKAVIIDERFLETLAPEELLSGSAEMIKHGLVSDLTFYNQLSENLTEFLQQGKIPLALIQKSIQLKNDVVLADPFEKGLRKILNFGHTVGHALESYSFRPGQKALSHGAAIGIGMICELYLSSVAAGLSLQAMKDSASLLFKLFGEKPILSGAYSDLYALMLNDKKNKEGQINFSLLEKLGTCRTDCRVPQQEIFNSLDYFNNYFV